MYDLFNSIMNQKERKVLIEIKGLVEEGLKELSGEDTD